jgi:hypothetical protein
MMTIRVPRASALALGAAALVSLSTLSAARADSSSEPAPTPSVTAPAHPSSTPTPTPASSASTPSLAQNPPVRHYAHRHYAYSNGHRYYRGNPVGQVAMGVAGGAADLGSVAAYPFYCFPNYGTCRVRVPYRY